MVPTIILFGFVLGRWWKVTVPLAAIVWPLILVADGFRVDVSLAFEAGLLGFANAAVGAGLYLIAAGAARIASRSPSFLIPRLRKLLGCRAAPSD